MQLHRVQKKIFSFPFTLPINYFLIFWGEFLKTSLKFFWDYFCVCVWVQAHAWMQVPLEAKRCPEDELLASCEPPNTVYGNQAWVFWESSKSAWLQSHLFFPLGASFEDITSELHSSVGRQDLIKKMFFALRFETSNKIALDFYVIWKESISCSGFMDFMLKKK